MWRVLVKTEEGVKGTCNDYMKVLDMKSLSQKKLRSQEYGRSEYGQCSVGL